MQGVCINNNNNNNKRNLDGMHPKQNADFRACGRRERRGIGGIGASEGESQQRSSKREREREMSKRCAREGRGPLGQLEIQTHVQWTI